MKPAHGRIHLQGEDITGLSPDRIVSKGITLVPEGRRVFPDLTVLENLKIGPTCARTTSPTTSTGCTTCSPG